MMIILSAFSICAYKNVISSSDGRGHAPRQKQKMGEKEGRYTKVQQYEAQQLPGSSLVEILVD